MKIAYITDQYWPTISGVSVSIDVFRKELIKAGHTVYLLAPDHPGAADLDKKMNNRDIFRFKSFGVFFSKENRLVYRSEKKKIYRLLDELKPELMHIQTEFTLCKIATRYAKKKNIPLVMTAHTNWEELISHYVPFMPRWFGRIYARGRLRKTFNKADTLVVPTSLMEVLLNLYLVKVPIRVIPTGIDIEDFNRDNFHRGKDFWIFREYPRLKNKRILFFAGRIGKEKNITFLIDAVKIIRDKFPDIQLVIAGDGPEKTSLEKYTAEHGLEDNIIFTGFIERSRIKDLYSLAEVFTFSSKVESQGLVVLESMLCGTPVVAIGKMGTREIMGGDNGGYMVDDDLEMFTEKVMLLLKDKKLHRLKSDEALQHAMKWTSGMMAEKMAKLYRSMLNGS